MILKVIQIQCTTQDGENFSPFTTQAPCDKMPTNLTTAAVTMAQTAITMSWDTPDSGAPDHYFLEMTNLTTGQVYAWN